MFSVYIALAYTIVMKLNLLHDNSNISKIKEYIAMRWATGRVTLRDVTSMTWAS